MASRLILAAVMALGMGTAAFAADTEGATVTVKGVLQEDKNGFFVSVDGVFYDVRINDESKADMHKFFGGLDGDLVKVTGVLHIEEVADKKPYLILYSNDITRLKGEKMVVAATPQPVVVREVYVEQPHNGPSIHIPGVLHIGW